MGAWDIHKPTTLTQQVLAFLRVTLWEHTYLCTVPGNYSMCALLYSTGAILITIMPCFCEAHLAFQCAFPSIISLEAHSNPVRYVGQALLSPFDKEYSLWSGLHGNRGLVAKKPVVDFDGIMSQNGFLLFPPPPNPDVYFFLNSFIEM